MLGEMASVMTMLARHMTCPHFTLLRSKVAEALSTARARQKTRLLPGWIRAGRRAFLARRSGCA